MEDKKTNLGLRPICQLYYKAIQLLKRMELKEGYLNEFFVVF